MAEKNNSSEALNKHDLLTILEVNSKAIVIQTEVASQYEDILSKTDDLVKSTNEVKQEIITLENKIETKFDLIDSILESQHKESIKKSEELEKELFKFKILFVGGLLGLIANVIQLFIKR